MINQFFFFFLKLDILGSLKNNRGAFIKYIELYSDNINHNIVIVLLLPYSINEYFLKSLVLNT